MRSLVASAPLIFLAALLVAAPGCSSAEAADAGSETGTGTTGVDGTGEASGEATGGTGGGNGGGSSDCEDPTPQLDPVSGEPNGYVTCGDGFVHRADALACELPEAQSCDVSAHGDSCAQDADCTDGPNGYCVDAPSVMEGCGCVYSCQSDADCGSQEVCACANVTGDVPRCVPATCATSDDCGGGLCGLSKISLGCDELRIRLSCMDEAAQCRGQNCAPVKECFDDSITWIPSCRPVGESWSCFNNSCDGNCG